MHAKKRNPWIKKVKNREIDHLSCNRRLRTFVISSDNLKIMAMKKMLFSIFLCGLIIPLSAQIKGTVTDTGNNPVKFAKVAIYSLPDSVLIAGTTANEQGEFTFPNYNSVNKLMKVSYNGYKPKMFRTLPEQHVRLRDVLTMPDELAVKETVSSVPERKI